MKHILKRAVICTHFKHELNLIRDFVNSHINSITSMFHGRREWCLTPMQIKWEYRGLCVTMTLIIHTQLI